MNMSLPNLRGWWGREKAKDQAQPPVVAPAEAPWLTELDRAQIPRTLNYSATTLGRMLDQAASRFPDVTAIIYGHKQWSYRELREQVDRLAGGLAARGIRRGDRVLLTLPNCPEFAISFFAVQKLGGIVINAGPLMGRDDLRAVIEMAGPRAAIGLDLQAPVLGEAGHDSTIRHFVWVSLQVYQSAFKRLGYQIKLWQGRGSNGRHAQHLSLSDLLEGSSPRLPKITVDPTQTALLQPTGGTTGGVKLAELSHANLLANAVQVSTWMACRPGQERVVGILPMFHGYGLMLCLIAPVFNAGTILVETRFDPRGALEMIRRCRPTILPMVPAIAEAICNQIEREDQPAPLDSIRLCFSGAAPLSSAAAERFQKIARVPVVEGYGLTEASPVTHASLPGRYRQGSIGLPMPDTRVRVVDLDRGKTDVPPGENGELLVAGPQVMRGYFADADQSRHVLFTDEQGTTWLRTGDIVRYDQEGYFYVMDRKKDMIIRSGEKIYPTRVETVLRTHRLVSDVAVVGRDDPGHTQMVVAIIAPAEKLEDEKRFERELRALCREHLSPFEVPAKFEFVEKLPRSVLGKLLRKDLREPVRAAATSEPKPTEQEVH